MRDPGDVLNRTLDAVTAKLRLRKGFELPRQCFVHTGQLAFDCELLAVHAIQVREGAPNPYGPAIGKTSSLLGNVGIAIFSLDLGVTILRSQPNVDNAGRIPTGQVLSAASARATNDAAALVDAYSQAVADGSLADVCDEFHFGGITWVGPQGGLIGTTLNLSIQL